VKKRERTFKNDMEIFTPLYAWYLRRRGYITTKEEYIDPFLSGWFVYSETTIVGVKEND